jgi:hypothetical protein
LDSLVRIEPFQRVALTPRGKKAFSVFALFGIRRASDMRPSIVASIFAPAGFMAIGIVARHSVFRKTFVAHSSG